MKKDFFEKNIKKVIIAGIVGVLSITGVVGNEVIDNKNEDSIIETNQNDVNYNETESNYSSDDEIVYQDDTKSDNANSNNNADNNVSYDDSNSEDIEIIYEFRKEQYLEEHFEKHGDEFDYDTAEEYEEGANRVILSDDALHKIEKEDGDEIYYIENTNEFVVVSTDGYIRTYFKPSDGLDYFNRQ